MAKKKLATVFSGSVGNPWHKEKPNSRRKLDLKKKKGKK